MAEKIGTGRCPICGGNKARFSLSKSQYVVMTCSGCSCQVFARGDLSDEKLRLLIEPAAVASPVPAAPIVEAPKPAALDVAPVESPAVDPLPKKKKSGSFLEMFEGAAS